MGTYSPGTAEAPSGPGGSAVVRADVGDSTVVAAALEPRQKPIKSDKGSKNIQKSSRRRITSTTLGNMFLDCEWVMDCSLSFLQKQLRILEAQQDISPNTRSQWLKAALHSTGKPAHRKSIQQCLRRLENLKKQPKYPAFFPLEPLVQLAFGTTSNTLTLLDKLLL